MAKFADIEEVSRLTLADRIYEQLRGSIIKGEMDEGTELNQVELSESFGVSRVPVREAMRRLQAENLIEANPYQRYVISTRTPADILEMVELRGELEVLALRRTMERLRSGETGLERARAIVKRQSLRSDGEDWLASDMEFHRQFHSTPVMAAAIDDLRERVHRYIRVVVSGKSRRTEVIREHEELLKAVSEDKEEEAVALLRAHVEETYQLLASHLQRADGAELPVAGSAGAVAQV